MYYGYAPNSPTPVEDKLPIYWGLSSSATFSAGDESGFDFYVTDDPVGRYVFGDPDSEYLWLCIPDHFSCRRDYFENGPFGIYLIPYAVVLELNGTPVEYTAFRTYYPQNTSGIEIEVLPA